MDHQACRKRDLQLWQVLEPPRHKAAHGRTGAQAKQGSQGRPSVRTKSNVQIVTLEPDRTVQRCNRARVNAAAVKRRRAKKRRRRIYRCMSVTVLLALCTVLFATILFLYQDMQEGMHIGDKAFEASNQDIFWESGVENSKTGKPKIQEDFLSISEYNRPGTKLAAVNSIFVHYTANPKTTAAQNRSYFENLGKTHERAASAHFIIGYEGEIIQCIPLDEEAYAVKGRNSDSISIECCYINKDGSFTQATYDSLIHMLAWLMHEYDLSPQDILRHYDSSEKLCPLYYVEHEDAWEKLLYDVGHYTLE